MIIRLAGGRGTAALATCRARGRRPLPRRAGGYVVLRLRTALPLQERSWRLVLPVNLPDEWSTDPAVLVRVRMALARL